MSTGYEFFFLFLSTRPCDTPKLDARETPSRDYNNIGQRKKLRAKWMKMFFLFYNFRKSYNNIIKRWLFTSLYYRKLDFYRSDWLSDNFYCRLTVSLQRSSVGDLHPIEAIDGKLHKNCCKNESLKKSKSFAISLPWSLWHNNHTNEEIAVVSFSIQLKGPLDMRAVN